MDNVKGLKQLKDQDRGPAEEEDEHHHRQHRHHLQLYIKISDKNFNNKIIKMKNKDEHQHRAGAPFILPFIIYPQKDFYESLIASCVTNHHFREAWTCHCGLIYKGSPNILGPPSPSYSGLFCFTNMGRLPPSPLTVNCHRWGFPSLPKRAPAQCSLCAAFSKKMSEKEHTVLVILEVVA